MAPELVKKTRIKLENSFIYFINNKGHLCKIKEISIPGKKIKPLIVKKLSIKKQPGFAYFVDKQGDVRKVFLEEGSKFIKKMKKSKTISKINKKLKTKR